jgi:hypothetical protein
MTEVGQMDSDESDEHHEGRRQGRHDERAANSNKEPQPTDSERSGYSVLTGMKGPKNKEPHEGSVVEQRNDMYDFSGTYPKRESKGEKIAALGSDFFTFTFTFRVRTTEIIHIIPLFHNRTLMWFFVLWALHARQHAVATPFGVGGLRFFI